MARTITKRSPRTERDPSAAPMAVEPPPLFTQGNVRKPEYWQFARLIAPAAVLPSGKTAWTADDAVGIWCERCSRKLQYQKGSSQSIRYHMETKHSDELLAFRNSKAVSEPVKKDHPASPTASATASVATSSEASATSAAPSRGTKRKECPTTEAAAANKGDPSSLDHVPALAEPHDNASGDLGGSSDERDAKQEDDDGGVEDANDLFQVDESAPVTAAAAPTSSLITPRDVQTLEVPSHASDASATAPTAPVAAVPAEAPSATSWHRNVQRCSGFWGNAYWYDLHLTRRMPLAEPMLRELVAALPPCDGKRVLDLCAGSGRASAALLAAYPTAHVTLVDASEERLAIAYKRLLAAGADTKSVQFVTQAIRLETDDSVSNRLLASAEPGDVVVACLALHVLAEQPAHYAPSTSADATKEALYECIFRRIFASLAPGGHVVFGDHVRQLGLFAQLAIMARVGFVDVDCAWRQDDSFVAGGRRPLELEL